MPPSVACKNISNALKRSQDFFALLSQIMIILLYLLIERRGEILAELKEVWLS